MARAALVAAVLALAAAAPASADSILYRCFPNLCRVAPDGSGQAQLTRDGAEPGPVYAWLSATPDGSRLGVSYGNEAVRARRQGPAACQRPAPAQRRSRARRRTSAPTAGRWRRSRRSSRRPPRSRAARPTPHQVPYLFLARADGSGREVASRSTVTTAWLGGRLLRDDAADQAPFQQQICVLVTNTDFPCERLVAAEPGHELWDPAVSPDGTPRGRDARADRRLLGRHRDLLRGDRAARARRQLRARATPGPTWSPDGRSIAFARGDGGLWVVSATGAPGSERRILDSGIQPVWVRGGGATLRLTGAEARPRRASACGSGWPARRAARACGCSAAAAGAGARSRPAARARRGPRSASASRAAAPCCGRRSGRPAGATTVSRRAARSRAVAPANVNGGWVGSGFRPAGGTSVISTARMAGRGDIRGRRGGSDPTSYPAAVDFRPRHHDRPGVTIGG